MLSGFIDRFYNDIKSLSEARVNPFTSYGYYELCKKKLVSDFWLFQKAPRTGDLPLDQVISLLENEDKATVIEATAFLLDVMTVKSKSEHINALCYSEQLRPISKEIVHITQSYQLLNDSVLDQELRLCQLLTNNDIQVANNESDEFFWLKALKHSNSDELLQLFTELIDSELLDSKLMSLMLVILTPFQVNALCNYSSSILRPEDALCLLLRGGMVKNTPLVNSLLLVSETPEKLVAEIRNALGLYLDDIVPFELQLAAWQGDKEALEAFCHEFMVNWPKYEALLCAERLINGLSVSSCQSLISKKGMNYSSFLLQDLFEASQLFYESHDNLEVISP